MVHFCVCMCLFQHHQVVGVVEVVVDLVVSRHRYAELVTVLAITMSLWYSVAIGVSRWV